MKKQCRVVVYFTPKDLELIQSEATKHDRGVSEYIRRVILALLHWQAIPELCAVNFEAFSELFNEAPFNSPPGDREATKQNAQSSQQQYPQHVLRSSAQLPQQPTTVFAKQPLQETDDNMPTDEDFRAMRPDHVNAAIDRGDATTIMGTVFEIVRDGAPPSGLSYTKDVDGDEYAVDIPNRRCWPT